MALSFEHIAQEILRASAIAAKIPGEPEKKLRELVSPLWDQYIKENRINLNFLPHDERQLANGRADTVYNRLILEYKKPGVIKKDNDKNRAVISQVQGYITDLAKEERWKESRLLGIAFDGNYFIYARKIGKAGRWVVDEPRPVNAESVEFFLDHLEKLTSKAALTPDNLIKDFAIGSGAQNFIASNMIKAFYHTLNQNVNERVKAFFEQWALQFAEVHGAIENKKFDAETLFDSYGFSKKEQKDFNFLAFFFSLDSYYGLLMKLLAYQVVGFYTLKNLVGLPLTDWEKLSSDELKEKLAQLEEGGIFRSVGIRNFLEGDLLSWYLNDWNEQIDGAVREMIKRLNQYDPETLELLPDETRDILKKLYQFLVPKQIRHDLGEYYTPDWLAERCLNQVGYGPKDPDLMKKRVLDPGCGSGTFLILAIKRFKEHAKLKGIPPADTLNAITRNIVGFDLNPLAVISARTNYLLAVADLLPHKKGEMTIPIYLCDSINPPSAREQTELLDHEAGAYQVSTSVGLFTFPDLLIKRDVIGKVAEKLEDSIKKKAPKNEFLSQVREIAEVTSGESKKFDAVLGSTFEKLVELDRKGINGIWARIIKNAFAPLFVGRFDYVIGNPPWVNWESLPKTYRDNTAYIWKRYDLFEHKGLRARLGSSKDDISALMVYVSLDKYSQSQARLCFVITQTLFKTVGGGEGFRRFRLGKKGKPFQIVQVDDMVDLQPFDAATNKTAVILIFAGKSTDYPVPYHIWLRNTKGPITEDLSWKDILDITTVKYRQAIPIGQSSQGAWITGRAKALKALKRIVGISHYQAREGSSGGLNSVFLIRYHCQKDGLVQVSNFTENAKKRVREIITFIEPDLVYPTLRGREIERWSAASEIFLLVPQDIERPANALPIEIMKLEYPNTYRYLEEFESDLRERSILKKFLAGQPFYAIYGTGPYSFSPFKVVWTRVGNDLKAAVVGNQNVGDLKNSCVTPIETVVYVSFQDIEEAHYFCAMINSSPSRCIVVSYSNKGSGSFGSPHILENVAIPAFERNNSVHLDLSRLSILCHERKSAGVDIADLEHQIDLLSAEAFNVTGDELEEMKASLEEMS